MKEPVNERRFDLAPILRAYVDQATIAERHGVTTRTLRRWQKWGLTAAQADELAIAAGFHPSELWPDWDTQVQEIEAASSGYEQLTIFL